MYRFESHSSLISHNMSPSPQKIQHKIDEFLKLSIEEQIDIYLKQWRWGDEITAALEKPRIQWLKERAQGYEIYRVIAKNAHSFSLNKAGFLVAFALLSDCSAVEAKLTLNLDPGFVKKYDDVPALSDDDVTLHFVGLKQ